MGCCPGARVIAPRTCGPPRIHRPRALWARLLELALAGGADQIARLGREPAVATAKCGLARQRERLEFAIAHLVECFRRAHGDVQERPEVRDDERDDRHQARVSGRVVAPTCVLVDPDHEGQPHQQEECDQHPRDELPDGRVEERGQRIEDICCRDQGRHLSGFLTISGVFPPASIPG
jgi:hypothetical protein